MPAWKNKIKKCGKKSLIFVLSFQQISVPLPQLKLLQPMKTDKKIRNELFFCPYRHYPCGFVCIYPLIRKQGKTNRRREYRRNISSTLNCFDFS